MPDITFIFKTPEIPHMQFGKIIFEYLRADHNGLDNEIKIDVLCALNTARVSTGLAKMDDVCIGILSLIDEFSSNGEKDIFDLFVDCFENTYYYANQEGKIIYSDTFE